MRYYFKYSFMLYTFLFIWAITAFSAELRRTDNTSEVRLGESVGRALNTTNVKFPDPVYKFPLQKNEAKILFNNIPDWGTEGFTAEIWCKADDDECGYAMLLRGSFGLPKIRFGKDFDTYVVLQETGKSTSTRIYSPVEKNKFHHFVYTADNKNGIFYLNGKERRRIEGNAIPKYEANSPLRIGDSIEWSAKNFVGEIGLIRIYNKALTKENVAKNATALQNGEIIMANEGVIFETNTQITEDFWEFSGKSSITVPKVDIDKEKGIEIKLTLITGETSGGTILELEKLLKLEYEENATLKVKFAENNFKYENIIDTEKTNQLKIACNGNYLQIWNNGQALNYAEKINSDKIPKNTRLKLGENFQGIIGAVSIDINNTLPKNLGEKITVILDNSSVDRFSHPKNRHIDGKVEKDQPLIDFENLDGWTLSYPFGAVQARLTRSQEEPLWGDYVLRSEFRKGEFLDAKDAKVILAPPQPVKIKEDFDAINIWRFATSYDSRNRPRMLYSIQFRDSEGTLHSSGPMGGLLETGWGIHHMPLQTIKAPAEFVSITFSNFHEDLRITYFDSLRFYSRSKAEISDADIPSWEELGLPLRPETILPTPGAECKVELIQNNERSWSFISSTETNEKLIFNIRAEKGTLDDITVNYKGKTFAPLTGAGFHWALDNKYPVQSESLLAPGAASVKAKFLGALVKDKQLILNWHYQITPTIKTDSSWILELKDNSLIVDLSTSEGCVGEFQFGGISGISGKVIEVPYLAIGSWIHRSFSPGIFAADGIYVSAFIDWYNSDASGLFGESSARPGGHFELNLTTADHRWVPDPNASDPTNVIRDYSIINGGSYYWPTTAGQRNPARERFFLTVTDKFDATLPNIPNPSHQYLQETAEDVWATRMWYVSSLPCLDYFDRELEMWKLCKAYGLERLNVRLHGSTNRQYVPRRDGGPSTFIEDFVEPGLGGNEKCGEFFQEMKKLGYKIGHYTDHMLLSQLSYDAWDEDMLNLDPNSRWLYSSGMCKQTKISRMVALQAKYNAYMRRDFAPNCAYLDQITCPPCWRYTDYDARVPDAGKFSAAYRVFVASLRQEEKDFGPVLSEGKTQIFFAGICDSYAQPQRMEMNLIPNFNLQKLHTLSNDCGYELSLLNWKGSGIDPEKGVYRNLAYQYAYGNTAHIYGAYHGAPFDKEIPAYFLKSYFLIQPLQKFYALTPIKSILYNVNGRLLPIESAIKNGSIVDNQVKLLYENGLEVAANLNKTENFSVTLYDKEYLLPPDGFAALLPGHCEAFSALIDGRRLDYMRVNGLEFSNGVYDDASVKATDAFVLKEEEDALILTPTPFSKKEMVTLKMEKLPAWRNIEKLRVEYLNKDATIIKSETISKQNGQYILSSDGQAFSYRLCK